MLTNRRLLAALLATFVAVPALAIDLDGFLREKNRGDVALSFTRESYDEFWAGTTKVSDPGLGKVTTDSLSLWLAYGLTDDLTLVASLPYVDTEGDGLAGFHEKDLQDLTICGKYRFFSRGSGTKSDLVGAFGIRTIASNYEANLPVDVGDGTADWLARVIYLLRHRSFYFSQQVGFDLRSGDAPNGYPLYTEVGYTWGRTTCSGFYSKLLADGGTDIGDKGFTFPSNQEEYDRVGAKVFWRATEKLGVSARAFTTLDGRNTGDSDGISVGLDVGF